MCMHLSLAAAAERGELMCALTRSQCVCFRHQTQGWKERRESRLYNNFKYTARMSISPRCRLICMAFSPALLMIICLWMCARCAPLELLLIIVNTAERKIRRDACSKSLSLPHSSSSVTYESEICAEKDDTKALCICREWRADCQNHASKIYIYVYYHACFYTREKIPHAGNNIEMSGK